mmetsp:Transcript_749/g.1578  ORF Transcript_749/g.1578 Transcript_749/m.1578 type:complete len:218 (+) Transcript_749:49-702(+)
MPRRLNVPGPGHYHVSQDFGKDQRKACSIHGKAAELASEPIPGPSDYPSESPRKVPPRVRFGTASRFHGHGADSSPGPAEYSPRDPRYTAQSQSIGERHSYWQSQSTPGPGTYVPEKAWSGSAAGTLPSISTNFARRSGRLGGHYLGGAGLESPGPAAYQLSPPPTYRKIPATAFGTSPRLKDHHELGQGPGPGAYSLDLKPRGPKVSITPRREIDF